MRRHYILLTARPISFIAPATAGFGCFGPSKGAYRNLAVKNPDPTVLTSRTFSGRLSWVQLQCLGDDQGSRCVAKAADWRGDDSHFGRRNTHLDDFTEQIEFSYLVLPRTTGPLSTYTTICESIVLTILDAAS
ncbi:hypothetical protein BJX63DRAFT_388212 [Aspergillus granulosus]|uniref:Secreted protein n=1 Tax=Aspergillus granulosus TaxID=176169 RepID=A0ABR4HKS4_9EURO